MQYYSTYLVPIILLSWIASVGFGLSISSKQFWFWLALPTAITLVCSAIAEIAFRRSVSCVFGSTRAAQIFLEGKNIQRELKTAASRTESFVDSLADLLDRDFDRTDARQRKAIAIELESALEQSFYCDWDEINEIPISRKNAESLTDWSDSYLNELAKSVANGKLKREQHDELKSRVVEFVADLTMRIDAQYRQTTNCLTRAQEFRDRLERKDTA